MGPNIILRIFLSKTNSFWITVSFSTHVSEAYVTVGLIIVLCGVMFDTNLIFHTSGSKICVVIKNTSFQGIRNVVSLSTKKSEKYIFLVLLAIRIVSAISHTFIRCSSNTILCTCSLISGVVAHFGRPSHGSSSRLVWPRLNSATHFLIVENEEEESP